MKLIFKTCREISENKDELDRICESCEHFFKKGINEAIIGFLELLELMPDYSNEFDDINPSSFITDECKFKKWIEAIALDLRREYDSTD